MTGCKLLNTIMDLQKLRSAEEIFLPILVHGIRCTKDTIVKGILTNTTELTGKIVWFNKVTLLNKYYFVIYQ